MERHQSLGIVDWGIGGIGVYRSVRSRYPDVPITYFSDSGAKPYGAMARLELVSRLNRVIEFLKSQGVSHLLLGCNAASTVLPLLEAGDVPLKGVIESAIRSTTALQPPKLALIGGARTIRSGVYRKGFATHGIELTQRIAQPLSALIERGDTSSPMLRDECSNVLAPIRNSSHLLLACTHYPAIAPMLKDLLSPETVLIDPAEELAAEISHWALPSGRTERFMTTGDPEMMRGAAAKAFGVVIGRVERVTI